jgi:plastocyanin
VRRRPILVLVAAGALAAAGTSLAQSTTLTASVGPDFEISLTRGGARVTQLDPGTYEIEVNDRSDFHNFHLSGPGVDERTAVEFVGRTTWTVNLRDGNYRFVCDPHATTMRGTFVVGNPPAPPPPPPPPSSRPLVATVGPGAAIGVRTPAGARVAATAAGLYRITVRDRSASDNFHLIGPGVNRKTGVAFRGTVTWNVRLQAAKTYRFVSDRRAAALKGSFRTR